MHLFLLLLVVVGSAFFVSKEKKPVDMPSLKVVPSILVDQALSGGGGNPKITPSDGRQRGQLTAQPPDVRPTPPPKPPAQSAEVKKPTPTTTPKENPIKPKENKETSKPNTNPKTTKLEPLELKPVVRNNADKAKAKAEAQAREMAAAKKRTTEELRKTRESLQRGFAGGTVVEAFGPGGEAYADYAQFVKNVYEDAWIVTDDLMDDDSTARVIVTIRRTGQVVSARIERRSGDSTLDNSVQRALDKVRFIAPFPQGAKEDERTFKINFNLKAKRLVG